MVLFEQNSPAKERPFHYAGHTGRNFFTRFDFHADAFLAAKTRLYTVSSILRQSIHLSVFQLIGSLFNCFVCMNVQALILHHCPCPTIVDNGAVPSLATHNKGL